MTDEDKSVAGIALPDDITSLSDKEIDKFLSQVAKAFAPFNDESKVVTAEDLPTVTALVEQAERLQAEQGARAQAAEETAAKVAELRQRMGTQSEEAPEEETPAEEEAPAEAPVEEAPAEEPAAPEAEAELPLAASASRQSAVKGGITVKPRKVAAAKTEVTPRGENVTIVASSDIPNVPTGQTLDRDGLSEALHSRARMMSDLKGGGKGALVASIVNDRPKNDLRKAKGDEAIRDIWARAHDTKDMVASGGWCAPSETVYDFVCDYEALPDVLDLPSMTSTRGGLRYPTSPLLADVYEDVNSGFTWTEADDIAATEPGGPTKPCFSIPCPDFDETRLQAQGICVTAGNLTDRAYPELTNRYVDLVLTAHAHRMNYLTIEKVRTASTAVNPTEDTDLGAAEALLGNMEFLINRFRDAFFAGEDFTLEAALPRWARAVVRRDMARRNGVEWNQVTNAEIAQAFSEIGARVQFISNYQPLASSALVYPSTVEFLLYPAGAHTRMDGGSLDLGVTRDSTLNATNDYTAAWTEEFWGVVSRCASYKVTTPICASGTTGAQATFACPSV